MSINCQTEKTRVRGAWACPYRLCERKVSVLATKDAFDPKWVGVQRLIRVERSGTRADEPFEETVFYISSSSLDGAGFAQRIRQHWHIENRLH